MFKYYLKTSWRRVLANKTYTLLNVGGLSLGLAVVLLIGLFVHDEITYDSFHEHKDHIYRVVTDATWPSSPTTSVAITSRPVANALREYPAVEKVVQLVPFSPTITYEGSHFRDREVFYAEESFFDVFTFPLVHGDPDTALEEPYSAVISESTARLLFRDQPAVGRTVTFNNSFPVTITGIAADPPERSHLSFDVLVSYATHDLLRPAPIEPQWLELNTYLYLLLDAGTDVNEFREYVRGLPEEHYGSVLEQYGVNMDLNLQPLTEIYLHSHRNAEIGPVGNYRHVLSFAAIALLVLLIACINYVNLATARSLNRAKEVGVRKVLGADRPMIARLFLISSIITVALATVVALVLLRTVLPFFNEWAGKSFEMGSLFSPSVLVAIAGLVLLVGLLAGAYPALILSRYQPAPILRGSFKSSVRGVLLRRGLVTVQFAISTALIVASLVIVHQLNHLRTHGLGFEPERLITIDARGIPTNEFAARHDRVKDDLLQHPLIEQASVSSSSPGREPPLLLLVAEGMDEGDSRRAHILSADYDYVSTYGIDVIAGRTLSRDYESDSLNAAVINQRAVDSFGWSTPEEALGKWVQFGSERRTIVGVLADYHHLSLRQAVEPMKLLYLSQSFNTITIRVQSPDSAVIVRDLRRIWDRHFSGHTFMYSFVDEHFDQQYRTEVRLTEMMIVFAGLAITLACLGLFGLSVYTVQQRRREIGIRKVLGANPSSIFGMVTKDTLQMVILGFCIGAPLAYLAVNQWLEGFAHRVSVGPGLFALAGIGALVIALLTVSYQALKAAWMNPTDAIEQE